MRRLFLLLLLTTAFTVQAAPLENGMVDDPFPVLSYTGTWTNQAIANAYGGGYKITSDPAAMVTFQTYAPGVTIFFLYYPTGDDVEVCVGMDCTTFSTAGATSPTGNVGSVELSGFAPGLKTITLAKDTADGSYFLFDALYIHPSAYSESNGSEVPYQITDNFDYNGQSYTGVWELRITSGESILALLMSLLIIFQLFNVIWQVRQ